MKNNLAWAAALIISLWSCSDFLLYDEFPKKGELPSADTALRIVPAAAAVTTNGSINFVAQGGTPGYVYSVASGGGSIGAASGVYTAPAVAGSASIRVSDAAGATSDAAVSIIGPSVLAIFPSAITLSAGASFQFSASGGSAPYSYSLVSGVGSISAAGLYTAPGVAGSAVVRATDSASATSDASVTVVSGGLLGVNPTTPSVEEGASLVFTGYGGTPGYVYSLQVAGSGGSMVAGLYTAGTVVGSGIDTVRVTDQNGAGSSTTTTVTVVPAAPSNLVADGSFGGPAALRLTWQDNSLAEGGFRIERKTGGAGVYAWVADVGANVTTFDDAGLTPNTAYIYRVRAFSGALNSSWSNEAFDLSNS